MNHVPELKARLEGRLEALQARLARIDSHLRDPGSADSKERATELENDEVLDQLSDAETREVDEIRAALGRIEAGTYGRCSRCGDDIAAKRLEVLPFARTCVRCAE